jgi:hypothetical protein
MRHIALLSFITVVWLAGTRARAQDGGITMSTSAMGEELAQFSDDLRNECLASAVPGAASGLENECGEVVKLLDGLKKNDVVIVPFVNLDTPVSLQDAFKQVFDRFDDMDDLRGRCAKRDVHACDEFDRKKDRQISALKAIQEALKGAKKG